MKKIKKLKYILTSFIFLLPFISFAISFDKTSPQLFFTEITPICDNINNVVDIFDNNGNNVNQGSCNLPITQDLLTGVGIYTFVECNTLLSFCNNDPIEQERLELGYVGETIFVWTSATPTGLFHTKNLFGEISNSPVDLMASVGTVSGDTFNSALPWLLIAVGIGIAFYIGQSLIEVIPKDTKKTKKSYDIMSEKSVDGTYHATFKEIKDK